MKLSILVCGVHSRIANGKAIELLNELNYQVGSNEDVEILYLYDNKKRMLGTKRNDLVEIAAGEYITFIDDDDKISPNYVSALVKAIDENSVDMINFIVDVSLNDGPYKPCHYSIANSFDFNTDSGYFRLPNHIMCVKRELALQVKYKDILYGEDSDYSKRLAPLIKTELNLSETLYYYNYNQSTTETQQHLKNKRR